MKNPIKILVVKNVLTRKFNVEFEVSVETFDYWKGDKSDQEYIQELINTGLSQQGLKMSE